MQFHMIGRELCYATVFTSNIASLVLAVPSIQDGLRPLESYVLFSNALSGFLIVSAAVNNYTAEAKRLPTRTKAANFWIFMILSLASTGQSTALTVRAGRDGLCAEGSKQAGTCEGSTTAIVALAVAWAAVLFCLLGALIMRLARVPPDPARRPMPPLQIWDGGAQSMPAFVFRANFDAERFTGFDEIPLSPKRGRAVIG